MAPAGPQRLPYPFGRGSLAASGPRAALQPPDTLPSWGSAAKVYTFLFYL